MALTDIQNVLSIIQSLAVTVASVFAAMGFNKWRTEIIGKRKIELAEEALDIFSQFPWAIQQIRNPLIYKWEGKKKFPEVDNPNLGHVTLERMSKYNDYFSRINSIEYRFLGYFGQDKHELFLKAYEILVDIEITADTLVRHAHDSNWMARTDGGEKYENILSGSNEGGSRNPDEPINKRAEEIRHRILMICGPCLT